MSPLREGLGRRVLSYLEGVSMSPREGGAMNRGEPPAPLVRQNAAAARLTPGRGTFHFENLIMPPLTKTCPKMVLSHKRGSLCVKDVFAKKFFGAGRDSARGVLASVLRKHSTEGRTSVAPQWQSTLGEQGVNTISSPCRSAMTITFCSPETSTSQSQKPGTP